MHSMKAEILNLYSNEKEQNSRLKSDHGQSFLISIGDEKILFDAGQQSAILLHNMAELKVEPNTITKLVLSHGHFDHTRGLPGFLDKRTIDTPLPLIAHTAVREEKVMKMAFLKKPLGFPCLTRTQEDKLFFQLNDKPQPIAPSLYTTGEITERPEKDGIEQMSLHREDGQWRVDPMLDDISLVLHTREGAVIIAGCAHSGILNICYYVKQSTGKQIKAVIGGTHMVRYTAEEVANVADQLRSVYGYPDLYLNHCTDYLPVPFIKKTKAIHILKNQYGLDKVKHCRVGTTIRFTV